MDKWNNGIMPACACPHADSGLMEKGFLYNYLNLMIIIAIPTKIVSDATFFVVPYSIIPLFHRSNTSESGQWLVNDIYFQ